MGKRRVERVRARRIKQEDEEATEVEEEEGKEFLACLHNLSKKTTGTEEEAAEGLEAALGISTQEMEVDGGEGSEGEEGGGGAQQALEAFEFLTQDAEPSGTTLVDARNNFNELSRLAMLWTMCHRWPAGARFAFNCYKHWAQLPLRQPGELPVTILRREGVTQGDPLSMDLYGINLVSLAEELQAADPGLLSPFYSNDVTLDGSAQRSAHLLKLLMKWGPDRGYLPEPAKSLFISDTPGQKEEAKQEFAKEGLVLNFVSGIRFLGAYLGPQDQLEAGVKSQVEAWSHRVIVLGKI